MMGDSDSSSLNNSSSSTGGRRRRRKMRGGSINAEVLDDAAQAEIYANEAEDKAFDANRLAADMRYGGKRRRRNMRGGKGEALSPASAGPATASSTYNNMAQYGGSGSAWEYVQNMFGNGTTQFDNSLVVKPGQTYEQQNSNVIQQARQNGGRRSRKGKGRSKKGGMWGQVISQAVVPFGLVGLQNKFGNRMRSKKYRGNKSRRFSRRR